VEARDGSGRVLFERQRQVADLEEMRRCRVMLAVWAPMYEANKERATEVRDDSVRTIHAGGGGSR
jgi:hypothetical protein